MEQTNCFTGEWVGGVGLRMLATVTCSTRETQVFTLRFPTFGQWLDVVNFGFQAGEPFRRMAILAPLPRSLPH